MFRAFARRTCCLFYFCTPCTVPANVGANVCACENSNIHFISRRRRRPRVFFSIESSGPLAIRPTKGKTLAIRRERYWPVFSIQSSPWRRGAVGVFLDSRSRSLSLTWTSEPSLESLTHPRAAEDRKDEGCSGEVSPDWRPWTIDQLETSPLF